MLSVPGVGSGDAWDAARCGRRAGSPAPLAETVNTRLSGNVILTFSSPTTRSDGGRRAPTAVPTGLAWISPVRLASQTNSSSSQTGHRRPTALDVRPLWVTVQTRSVFSPQSAGTCTLNTNDCRLG